MEDIYLLSYIRGYFSLCLSCMLPFSVIRQNGFFEDVAKTNLKYKSNVMLIRSTLKVPRGDLKELLTIFSYNIICTN